jgi:proline dehydrogenase
MLSFDNTEIAFQSKSDKDLKQAHFLFRIIGKPAVVKFGKVATNFSLKIGLPIKGIIRKTIFKQFCGGENIEDCTAKIEELYKFGVGTILDYSVEGKTEDKDFEATTQEIIKTIEKAQNNPAIPFAVFKMTGITRFGLLEKINDPKSELSDDEKIEFQALLERVDRICKRGFDLNVPVFIDAEDFCIQDAIDRITTSMMVKYNRESGLIYNTLQMYRNDRHDFLKKAIENAKIGGYYYGVKLVRGAYMEKERERALKLGYPDPIHANKEATDNDYDATLDLILKNINIMTLCAGSHNEESAYHLIAKLNEFEIQKNDKRVYFAQLLGMSDHISFNLANAGYNVAKYVPYGPIEEVMPYLLRRADENTSVAGQTGRELSLLNKEKQRRKI